MIITLHVNGFNAPTTTDRLAEGIKQDHYMCCLEQTHLRTSDTYRLKVRCWQETFHANGNQKKPGVTIVISDEIDFKTKTITKNKNGHYILIRGSNQGDNITNVNNYEPTEEHFNT